MFLILLILFPLVSYRILSKFKDYIIELNWISKLIWMIGLFILIFVITIDIFDNNDSYLMLLIFWYGAVFIYYYIAIARLQFINVKKLVFLDTNIWEKLIKILFLLWLFIFYISIIENYDVNNKLDIIRWHDKSLINFVWTYFISVILCGIFYEIVDVLKYRILFNESTKDDYRTKLKNELKTEILKELNITK